MEIPEEVKEQKKYMNYYVMYRNKIIPIYLSLLVTFLYGENIMNFARNPTVVFHNIPYLCWFYKLLTACATFIIIFYMHEKIPFYF